MHVDLAKSTCTGRSTGRSEKALSPRTGRVGSHPKVRGVVTARRDKMDCAAPVAAAHALLLLLLQR